ncbi:hypothetical protein LTR29_009748 [Friedmanniomyces endolithicus]|nr:hypothetical protein LTR29_009748 [Friedmanniomyces endolithicus]
MLIVTGRSLQADRLIDIYVGEVTPETTPFRVQQVLLGQLSDYFDSALKTDTFVEGKQGRLHFPEDNVSAWKVLLHWAFTRMLPHWFKSTAEGNLDDGTAMLLVDCWVLGDKYQIHAFQDEVMMEMLCWLVYSPGSCDVFKRGVELTSPGSKLRRLMAEGLEELYEDGYESSDLDQFDGMQFLEDYVQAKRRRDDHVSQHLATRFGCNGEVTLEAGPGGTWKEYMVGDKLPSRAWKWIEKWGIWGF